MAVSFDFRKRLGSGYFGEVWHVIEEGLGHEIALKCIPPEKVINQKNFFQEAQVLKASEHPNIVQVGETGTLDDGRVYVSMEYLPNGSLEDEAQGAPIALTRSKRIMIDVLRALGHAHSQGIVHRDIKPANIMIGNAGEGKLSDFGLALPDIQNLEAAELKQYQYVLHLAPEVRRLNDYTPLSDVYAAGVTLYRLINGDSNLPQISPAKAHKMSRKGEFPPRDRYREYVPSNLKRMINKALNSDPAKRYQSADEMRHALENLEVLVDWVEVGASAHRIWRGLSQSGVYYEISRSQQNDLKWQVETKKGRNSGNLRRVGDLCFLDLGKKVAEQRSRSILQSYVVGTLT